LVEIAKLVFFFNQGSNVQLDGAFIFDNVTLKPGVVVTKSIIGPSATILENVKVERGCVFEGGVVIGPAVIIPSQTRLTLESGSFSESSNRGISILTRH
jgi:UDP-3-O-[3-hydroxymyristoyl] glucosamine N-acyltransferase